MILLLALHCTAGVQLNQTPVKLASKAATKTLVQHSQNTAAQPNKRQKQPPKHWNTCTTKPWCSSTKHQRCRRQKAATKTHHRRLEAQCKTKTADREDRHQQSHLCQLPLCMTCQCSNTSSATSSMLNMCEYKVQCSSIRDFKILCSAIKVFSSLTLYCVQHSVQHTSDPQYGVKMNTPMQC